MFVFVSDVSNGRVVLLDLDLNWVNSFTVTSSYALTGDATYIYADRVGYIDKYPRIAPFALDSSSGSTRTTNDMDSDTDYIYLGVTMAGTGDKYVQIYNKSDLTFSDEFDTGLTSRPDGVTVDSTHIYVYGSFGDNLKKFLKSDHSEVASRDVSGDAGIGYVWLGMDQDTDYLYFTAGATGNGELIAVYNKSDLSQYKIITIAATAYAWDVAVYGDYVYQVDYSDHLIRKVKISDGSIVATFGEEGTSGSDTSHLNRPDGITVV